MFALGQKQTVWEGPLLAKRGHFSLLPIYDIAQIDYAVGSEGMEV